MILVAHIDDSDRTIPLIGIPACGIFHEVTAFDLLLPRILAGEYIGRRELADSVTEDYVLTARNVATRHVLSESHEVCAHL